MSKRLDAAKADLDKTYRATQRELGRAQAEHAAYRTQDGLRRCLDPVRDAIQAQRTTATALLATANQHMVRTLPYNPLLRLGVADLRDALTWVTVVRDVLKMPAEDVATALRDISDEGSYTAAAAVAFVLQTDAKSLDEAHQLALAPLMRAAQDAYSPQADRAAWERIRDGAVASVEVARNAQTHAEAMERVIQAAIEAETARHAPADSRTPAHDPSAKLAAILEEAS